MLPLTLAAYGFTASMLGMVVVLVIGAVSSAVLAPETAKLSLEECIDA